jgi:serine/threonine protein kinase
MHGSLFDLLHTSAIELPWSARLAIALETAQGMSFLHACSPPVVHGDLKSSNVLLTSFEDPRRSAKVAQANYSFIYSL